MADVKAGLWLPVWEDTLVPKGRRIVHVVS